MTLQPATASRSRLRRLAVAGFLALEAAIETGVLSLFAFETLPWVAAIPTATQPLIAVKPLTHS